MRQGTKGSLAGRRSLGYCDMAEALPGGRASDLDEHLVGSRCRHFHVVDIAALVSSRITEGSLVLTIVVQARSS